MRDVAAEAGVSPVVVSRVLHNKAIAVRVSEATAERVRQAATKLGYRCNVFARNFRTQQTMSIGVLHGIGFLRPLFDRKSRYFASLMDGIVEGSFRHGYSVNLCPGLMGPTPEDAISDGRFDGLVWYSTSYTDENLTMLRNCSVPLVLIHTPHSFFEGKYPTVMCDNYQGICLAVDHLTGIGHRKIAFALEGGTPNLECGIRLEAFKQHMSNRGLDVTEDDVVNLGWGAIGLDDYLAARPPHTAVITSNEGLGGEFILRAPAHGIRIPEDLSIVGFDSTAYCNELQPRLTAVFQPLVAIGNAAIDLLVKSIQNDSTEPAEIVLPCSFDIRGSTLPINGD